VALSMNSSNHIVFGWRRMPPPGFIGGAELTESAFAQRLATRWNVDFVGCSTDPRDVRRDSFEWLQTCCRSAGLTPPAGIPASWTWRHVRCTLTTQPQLLQTMKVRIANAAVVWTSQEGCAEIASLVSSDQLLATYAHSASEVGLLSASIGANVVLAPSKYIQHLIQKRYGILSELLRPPIEACTCPRQDPPDLRQILFVNPVRAKGLDLVAELIDALPDYRFVIVDGWETEQPLPCDTGDNVTRLTRRPDLHGTFLEASIVIVPSVVDDAAPRIVTEAGLHHRPVIGSRRGGIPELVGSSRLLLPPDDAASWIATIRQVTSTWTSWREFADAQQEWSMSLESGDATVADILETHLS